MKYQIKCKKLIKEIKRLYNEDYSKKLCNDWNQIFDALRSDQDFFDEYENDLLNNIMSFIENNFKEITPVKKIIFSKDPSKNEYHFNKKTVIKGSDGFLDTFFKVNKSNKYFKTLKKYFSKNKDLKDCNNYLIVSSNVLADCIRDCFDSKGSKYVFNCDFNKNFFNDYVWGQSRDFDDQDVMEVYEDHEWNPDKIYNEYTAGKLRG